jgi:copper chaperone
MTVELKVTGMTCGHCVRAVTQAIERADPSARVAVDLASGTLRAETALDAQAVARLVTGEGYEARPG